MGTLGFIRRVWTPNRKALPYIQVTAMCGIGENVATLLMDFQEKFRGSGEVGK